ncbi:Flp family type IVb pilin [Sinomonas terrae]|uniref:Flp family type IVb pilin n=1 Tax=Sinomonas terrae TaxID=2908838 RepID=A0ABS9TY43_9MICC|nr:Flp family type IVb pilin [Sinomonas terrae]MCH6469351.1 Flp family type IVb pilin [Sinomonas terrae]
MPEPVYPDQCDRGATATEYAILCGFIAMVILAGVMLFGASLSDYYNHLVDLLRTGLHLP